MKGLNGLVLVAAVMCAAVLGGYAQVVMGKRKPFARQHYEKAIHDVDNSGKLPEYWVDLSLEDTTQPGRWFTYECWPNGNFRPFGWKAESAAHAAWRQSPSGQEPDDFAKIK